mgnify:CR=1 FL=1
MLEDRHVVDGPPDIAFEPCRSESEGQMERLERVFPSVGAPTTVGEEDGYCISHNCIIAESGTMLMRA